MPTLERAPLSPLFLAIALALAPGAPAQSPAPKTAFHLEEATIGSIQDAILSHQITSVQLVKGYLARIKAYNGQSVEMPEGILGPIKTIPHAGQLNALSTLNLRPATRRAMGFDEHHARSMTDKADNDPSMPDALEVAAALDRRFAETGKLVGPLHGVIFAIKDQYDTFDMRTTSGADAFYANDRPPHDATFVKRLREAGAIILAKANLGEYAQPLPRSSFGGVFSNPYDTERTPGGSSSGSGSSVGANLVTCAIAEETGSSVRTPSRYNSLVGLAPSEEMVSHYGMIQAGFNTRIGPICRTVEDAAKVFEVISGYDVKDEWTAFGVGRKPKEGYLAFAREKSLKGVKIGVVREYMDKTLFTKADEQSIDLVVAALDDLKKLGATIVDPGPGGALFTSTIRKYYPQLQNAFFAKQYPDLFPVDAKGKPTTDQIATLVDMAMDPSKAPALTLRDLGAAAAPGEGKFEMNLYLANRGDSNIKTLTDLVEKANFYNDPHFGNRKRSLAVQDKASAYDTAVRLQRRFVVQQIVLEAMAEMGLDAVTYPSGNIPPFKLGAAQEPAVNGRTNQWTFLGQQGFPAITVPAGFTTEVYDRVRDPSVTPPARTSPAGEGGEGTPEEGTRLVGPVPAKLPVGIDFLGRPFAEATLFRIASAYQSATHHRIPPPDFGPVPGEP